jgi:hypothetical protein
MAHRVDDARRRGRVARGGAWCDPRPILAPGTRFEEPAMTHADTTRAFLTAEAERLAPFEFVAMMPSGNPLDIVEIARGQDGGLLVSVPGRPRMAPELPLETRSALRERGFKSEDAADRTRAWSQPAADVQAAIELAFSLLTLVFGAKPDGTVDVIHGSHEAEHEARKKLAFVRERVERILSDVIGKTPERDADGDFVLPIADVRVTVAPRALPGGPVVVRVFAVTNVNVPVTPDLGIFLARLNFSMMFGRFALDVEHSAIWFDETLLGEQFSDEELRFAVKVVSGTADEWDDRLKQMFGGATYQEVLSLQANGTAPPIKPGEGPGLYL